MARFDDQVDVGLGVIAMRNDEEFIVLHRDSEKHGSGTWSLPGGKPDPGESPVQGAIRELREETNAVVATVQPLFFWTYDVWADHNIHYVTLYFIGDVENPDEVCNVEPHKHSELRWVTWDTVPQPTFAGLDELAMVLG